MNFGKTPTIQNRLDQIVFQRDPCTGQYWVSTIDICRVRLSTTFIPQNAIGLLARSRFQSCQAVQSEFYDKGKSVDIKQVGLELGVVRPTRTVLLEGS